MGLKRIAPFQFGPSAPVSTNESSRPPQGGPVEVPTTPLRPFGQRTDQGDSCVRGLHLNPRTGAVEGTFLSGKTPQYRAGVDVANTVIPVIHNRSAVCRRLGGGVAPIELFRSLRVQRIPIDVSS